MTGTERTLPADTLGEGFAFFAWHRMRWNDYPAQCSSAQSYCRCLWKAGSR